VNGLSPVGAAREHLEVLIRRLCGHGDTARVLKAADEYADVYAVAAVDRALGPARLAAVNAEAEGWHPTKTARRSR